MVNNDTYGNQFGFGNWVFTPNWVKVENGKAGMMVEFRNVTPADEVPPLLAELRLYDTDPALASASVLAAASGGSLQEANALDATTLGFGANEVVLKYCVPWSDTGQVRLAVFSLAEFDSWLSEQDLLGEGLCYSSDPEDCVEPIDVLTLAQPQPRTTWYPSDFFGPLSPYVKVGDPKESMRSVLFYRLPAPSQSVALWLTTMMNGELRTSLIRFVA
jgi:hypothetical protein